MDGRHANKIFTKYLQIKIFTRSLLLNRSTSLVVYRGSWRLACVNNSDAGINTKSQTKVESALFTLSTRVKCMQHAAGSSSDNSNQPSQNSLQSMARFRFYLVLDLDCIVPRTDRKRIQNFIGRIIQHSNLLVVDFLPFSWGHMTRYPKNRMIFKSSINDFKLLQFFYFQFYFPCSHFIYLVDVGSEKMRNSQRSKSKS